MGHPAGMGALLGGVETSTPLELGTENLLTIETMIGQEVHYGFSTRKNSNKLFLAKPVHCNATYISRFTKATFGFVEGFLLRFQSPVLCMPRVW